MKNTHPTTEPVLITGATGKTGRRIAARLKSQGVPLRLGSRSETPPFDWKQPSTWQACLSGVKAIYISYAPDLAFPGAADAIRALTAEAQRQGVKRAVLLSGRGEEEAQACEKIVMKSGLSWTIVRASWFHQNFSEGAFIDMVMSGSITLPASEVAEPFVDCDDIADVAAAALVDDRHAGQVYEVTGPEMLTFAEIASILSSVTGRTIEFEPIPHDAFVSAVADSGAPQDVVWMMDYLFNTVLDGRNAHLTDGVRRALGREPKAFETYASETAATGVWTL